MSSRGVVAAVAFLLAAIATVAVLLYVSGVRDEAEGGGDQIEVVISDVDLPAGADLDDAIADGSFSTSTIAEDDLVEGVVTSLEQLEGRVTRYPILAGEQITTARLQGSADQLPGGVLGIPKGFEAISVSLDVPRVIGGAAQPGDHVTVFATFSHAGQSAIEVPVTVNLVADAQVLKAENPIAEDTAAGGAGQTLITLALRPRDAQQLVFAQEVGTVWMALIGPGEEGIDTPPLRFPGVIQ